MADNPTDVSPPPELVLPSTRFQFLSTLDVDHCPKSTVCRTGIVCTIGPACDSLETLERLLEAGMTVARLNCSHGTHAQLATMIGSLRTAQRSYVARIGRQHPLAIAIETKGPEIRLGALDARGPSEVHLHTGAQFRLTIVTEHSTKGSTRMMFVDYEGIVQHATVGQTIFLDDGCIELRVTGANADTIVTVVIVGGALASFKNVFVPNVHIDLADLADQDRADLRFAAEHDLDMVFLAFARDHRVLPEVRKVLGVRGQHMMLVAKVETREGLSQIDALVRDADGVLVSRSGLAMEMRPAAVVLAQKTILARCRQAGKVAVVGTQMLMSMRSAERALRVDVYDMATAVVDGADALLLSATTALGGRPVESVQCMRRTLLGAEAALSPGDVIGDVEPRWRVDMVYATILSAVRQALRCAAAAMVVVSGNGQAARLVSRLRPCCAVVAVVRTARQARLCRLHWGVLPLMYGTGAASEWGQAEEGRRTAFGLEQCVRAEVAKAGDRVVVLSELHNGPQCAMRVVTIETSKLEKE